MNSLKIKHALMSYFRFKRQWICASECLNNDVMAITDKDVIEVEIKISKYDLWKGEAKKSKHRLALNPPNWFEIYHANRFYICVPIALKEEAEKWVKVTNDKYGIIEYNEDIGNTIFISKTAKSLHDRKSEELEKKVMMRVCAENIGLICLKKDK